MFKEIRRAERQLNDDKIAEILADGEYGVLATVGENGYPYGVPVSYVYIDNKIYFHCARDTGHKLENIKNYSKVSFTVVGNTEVMPRKFATKYESVIAFGFAQEVIKEKQQALEKIIDKYSPDYKDAGLKYINAAFEKVAIYEIVIEHITGKACIK